MDGGNRRPFQNLRSAPQILRQAYIAFNSNLSVFFFLTILIISFRLVIQGGAHRVTSLIEQDHSLKRLDACFKHFRNYQPPSRTPEKLPMTARFRRARRLPSVFLRNGVLILEENLLFDSSFDEPNFYRSRKSHRNDSIVVYIDATWPFSDEVIDDGVKVLEIVRPGIKFKARRASSPARRNGSLGQGEENVTLLENEYQDLYRLMNKSSFVKDKEHRLGNLEGLFFIVTLLCVAQCVAILASVVTYASVFGVVFVAVVDDFLGWLTPSVTIFRYGSSLGLKKLFGFVLIRWALRDMLTHLLVLCFSNEIANQNSISKFFVGLQLVSLSPQSPWLIGSAKEMPAITFSLFFLDFFLAFTLSVSPWVFIVGSRRRGRPEIFESWVLMWKLFLEAIQINTLEVIGRNSLANLVVGLTLGRYADIVLQSLVEVYFMVAWLIFYFGAMSVYADSRGRRFERRELQRLIFRLL